MTVIPIPALDDNYIWLIREGGCAAVVDPGEAEPVLRYLEKHGLQLLAILCTHHHRDHTGGNDDLLQRYSVPVYGPRREPIPGITHPVGEGDQILLPSLSLQLEVLDIPGHTAGHVAYYGANRLFCGDTLFACGCGRLFEGTPAQMYASLQRLAALPDQTEVCCAHEYTLANIRFAKAVEPANPLLAAREAESREARRKGMPTLPSTLKLEKQSNPFLRCDVPAVRKAASEFAGRELPHPASVFAALREWKNRF
jgi:hydroxyacylglutathione hydrolase